MKQAAAPLFLLFFSLLIPFRLQSQTSKSETIALGVTATVDVNSTPEAKVPLGQALRRAFDEARNFYKDSASKSSGRAPAIDRMATALQDQGYTHFRIRSGSIWRTMGRDGSNYWNLDIPDIRDSKHNLCRVSLESSSGATVSGRNFDQPAQTDLRSVTVITKTSAAASNLARTAFLSGSQRAREILTPLRARGFGAILEAKNGKIQTIGDVTAACFEK